jgi:hypothetical protein
MFQLEDIIRFGCALMIALYASLFLADIERLALAQIRHEMRLM